jgi:hypothetical protein
MLGVENERHESDSPALDRLLGSCSLALWVGYLEVVEIKAKI